MTPEMAEQLQQAIEALGAGVEPGAGMWGLVGTMVTALVGVIFMLFKLQNRRDDRFLEALKDVTSAMGAQRKEDRDAVVEVGKELRELTRVCTSRRPAHQPAMGEVK